MTLSSSRDNVQPRPAFSVSKRAASRTFRDVASQQPRPFLGVGFRIVPRESSGAFCGQSRRALAEYPSRLSGLDGCHRSRRSTAPAPALYSRVSFKSCFKRRSELGTASSDEAAPAPYGQSERRCGVGMPWCRCRARLKAALFIEGTRRFSAKSSRPVRICKFARASARDVPIPVCPFPFSVFGTPVCM